MDRVTIVSAIASAASTRPLPASNAVAPATGTVESATASLSRSPSQPGCSCLRIAASPATCGVAIDVPSSVGVASSSTGLPSEVPAARAAVIDDTGGDHVRLQGAVAEPRAAAREVREHVGAVDRTDRQRGVGRARRGDRRRAVAAVVAGGDDEQRRRSVAESSSIAWLERVGAVAGVAAEAHADDVGALRDRPLHAGQDPRVLAEARVGEHLADQQVGAGSDALVLAGGGGPLPAIVEATWVPWPLPSTTLGSVVKFDVSVTRPGEIGVGRVVAGVEDGHRRAGAVVAGRPGLGRVDLRDRASSERVARGRRGRRAWRRR